MLASSHFNPGHPLPQTHINSFKCNSALTTSKTILLDKLLYDCLLTFHAILNTGELTHPLKKHSFYSAYRYNFKYLTQGIRIVSMKWNMLCTSITSTSNAMKYTLKRPFEHSTHSHSLKCEGF